MKKILTLVTLFLCLSTISFADELKYNPFSNEWSYERSDTQLQYNPFENRWEWAE